MALLREFPAESQCSIDGQVEMKYRLDGRELATVLSTGDIFYSSVGTEHVAHPIGQARILVVETAGSI